MRRTPAVRRAALSSRDHGERTLGAFATLLLSESGTVWDVLEEALLVLRQATAADAAEVFVAEPDGGDLLLISCSTDEPEAFRQQTRFDGDHGYPGIVVRYGAPIYTNHLADDPRFLRRSVVDRGFRTYACFPVSAGHGAPVGSLQLAWRHTEPDQYEASRLLRTSARLLGLALLADAHRTSSIVRAWLRQLPEETPQQALMVLLDRFKEHSGADVGRIVLAQSPRSRPLVVHAPRDSAWEPHRRCNPLSCGFLANGHGVLATDTVTGDSSHCQAFGQKHGNFCCLPLVDGGKHVGAVQLGYGPRMPDAFAQKFPQLLEVARTVAVGIAEALGRGTPPPSRLIAHTRTTATPQARLVIGCLGALRVEINDEALHAEDFQRRASAELLRILALNVGVPVSRFQLAEWLWPDCGEDQAANRLFVTVHGLRSALARHAGRDAANDWIRRRAGTYWIEPGPGVWIDVAEFRRETDLAWTMLRRGEDGRAAALEHLRTAVDLYRGDLFADGHYGEWFAVDREQLRRTYVDAVETLAEAIVASDDPAAAATDLLRRAVAIDTVQDDLSPRLLSALRAVSRRGAA